MGAEANPPRSRGGGGAADGGGSHSLRRPEVYEARNLRRNMSLPEVLLWRELKAGKQGVPFRKQHPIGRYKADFCCTERKLVVEIDGMSHDMGNAPERDAQRDAFMIAFGFAILRIPANDVLKRMDAVLEQIVAALPPLHHASAVPLPVNGEEL
jgi:very-short-patch-repair endonuclease